MKRFIVPVLIVGSMLVGSLALATGAPARKAARPAMHRYVITATHTQEECLKALDEFETDKALSKFEFGCKEGDHTAYCMVSAKSADDAKAMLPENQRANAKVVELHKFTPGEMKKIHQDMDKMTK